MCNWIWPQESDCTSCKEKFWNYLEIEVCNAQEEGIGLLIEIDSNAWAGEKLLLGDPNRQNNNGKHLSQFLECNKNIALVNTLPICHGRILELFIDCDRILPFVTKSAYGCSG